MATPDLRRPQYIAATRNGPSQALLDLPAGQVTVTSLVVEREEGVTLRLDGDDRVEDLSGKGPDMAGAFVALGAMLKQREITLRACGSCAAFRFSSLSYQFSGGSMGYCAVKGINVTGQDDVVMLLDRCAAFQPRPKGRGWTDDWD